ncbi:conjugal transfer protein [Mechercharimyces sp. CAU 1602]|uniref:conjugal transfer protein n=1 Tax=Mechercharimyces sp. CAU 1602 TaxID=2973933 RepID=UPI002162B265|nr:conjugal transfer protein [Mechercharimyces sp. CAU 1602]MCS1352812.1 conjugal transfer protein [Mechercharimyces sp. CAU 1602]
MRTNKRIWVARLGSWILIGSLVVLAGLSIYKLLGPDDVQGTMVEEKTVEYKVDSAYGAAKFAEDFAYYWLMHDLEKAQQYTAKGFEIPSDALTTIEKPNVLGTEAWAPVHTSKTTVSVLIKGLIEEGKGKEARRKTVYLSVPVVAAAAGQYGVYDIPTFVPKPSAPKVPETKEESGETVKEKEKIQLFLDSFFRQYTSGQASDLAQYFADGKSRLPLWEAKYNRLKSLDLLGKENGDVKANAEAIMEINGATTIQKYELILRREGEKWGLIKIHPDIPYDYEREEE